jgi:phage head-tail adaptor, putative, SPP1 family
MSNNVGERNRFLHVEKRSSGVDAANQPIDVWELVMKRWGKPLTSPGMSAVRAAENGVNASPARYSWRINFTPNGIDVGMRVNYKGVIFDILDIRHDYATREYTDLVCEQGGNNG